MIVRRKSKPPTRVPYRLSRGPELMGFSLNLAAPAPAWPDQEPRVHLGVRAALFDRSLLALYAMMPTAATPVVLYVTPEQAEELRDAINFTLERLIYAED